MKVWWGGKFGILNICWGKTSSTRCHLRIPLHCIEDRPSEFAGSIIFDLQNAVTGNGGLHSCLLSIGNCHRASWGKTVKAKIRSPTGRALKTVNVWQAQTQAQEVRRHRYCKSGERWRAPSLMILWQQERSKRHKIQVHSLRSSTKFPNRVGRNRQETKTE